MDSNRFSGGVPSTISALTALTYLYAAEPALPMRPWPTFIPRLLNGSARALLMIGSLAWWLILSNVQKVKRALLLLSAVGACDTDCMLACATACVRAHVQFCLCVRMRARTQTTRWISAHRSLRARARPHARRRLHTNAFNGPFPASIAALTRLVYLCVPAKQCSAKADSIGVRRCVVAQGSFQEPLQRFRAVGHLCTDRAHVSVSPRSASIIISTGHIYSVYRF